MLCYKALYIIVNFKTKNCNHRFFSHIDLTLHLWLWYSILVLDIFQNKKTDFAYHLFVNKLTVRTENEIGLWSRRLQCLHLYNKKLDLSFIKTCTCIKGRKKWNLYTYPAPSALICWLSAVFAHICTLHSDKKSLKRTRQKTSSHD